MNFQALDIIGLQWWLNLLHSRPIHPVPRHIQRILPLDQFIPLLTGVHGIEVGVWHLTSLDPVVGKQGDVAVTHESLAKNFDTML